jgi:hypothetical protein
MLRELRQVTQDDVIACYDVLALADPVDRSTTPVNDSPGSAIGSPSGYSKRSGMAQPLSGCRGHNLEMHKLSDSCK